MSEFTGLDFNEILNAGKKKNKRKAKKNKHKKKSPVLITLQKKNKSARNFTIPDDIDDDDLSIPKYTGKKWQGEHYNKEEQKWELREGYWYNPIAHTIIKMNRYGKPQITYVGDWQPGVMPIEYRYFYWFYEFFFEPANYADPVYPGKIHKKWAKLREEFKRNLFLCPRDHFKTTFLNSGHACYKICEFPQYAQMGILMIAWDGDLANEIYTEIRENLTINPKLLSYYGYIIDDNRPNNRKKLYFTYSPKGARYGLKCATFKSGAITGGHPYYVYADDIEDEALSSALMKKFKKVFLQKLIPAIGNFGEISVTGTVKGYNVDNDCYLLLKTNPMWMHHVFPAASRIPDIKEVTWKAKHRPSIDPFTGNEIINPNTGKKKLERYIDVQIKNTEDIVMLFPERYSIEDLIAKRIEMLYFDKDKDDAFFWREYQLLGKNPKGNLFDVDRLGTLPPSKFMNQTAFLDHLKKDHIPIYLWVDPGGRAKHGLAIAVIAIEKIMLPEGIVDEKYYWLEMVACREGIIAAADNIARLIVEYDIKIWAVEGNFNQKENVAEQLDREVYTKLKLAGKKKYFTNCQKINNTGNKEQRINTYMGSMIGIKGMPIKMYVNRNATNYEQFYNEFKGFPEKPEYKSHEFDIIDAGTSIIIHLQGMTEDFVWESGSSQLLEQYS